METDSGDKVSKGVGLACASMVAAFAAGYVMAALANGLRLRYFMLLVSWGLTQWLLIGPLILRHRRRGDRKIIKGLVIAGVTGLLVCAVLSGFVFV